MIMPVATEGQGTDKEVERARSSEGILGGQRVTRMRKSREVSKELLARELRRERTEPLVT